MHLSDPFSSRVFDENDLEPSELFTGDKHTGESQTNRSGVIMNKD
jgi:hypothetical protein